MKRAWSGKTQGGKWGQKFVLYYFKHGSLRLLYLVLYLVIPFYLIFDRKGYRATRWYAQKVGNKNLHIKNKKLRIKNKTNNCS